MKHLLIIIILIVTTFYVSAFDNNKADSLQNISNTATGIAKTKLLNELAMLYIDTLPELSIKYSSKALEYSNSIHSIVGIADSYSTLSNTYKQKKLLMAAIEHSKKAAKYYEKAEEYDSQFDEYIIIADIYLMLAREDNALIYNLKAKDVAGLSGCDKRLARALNLCGVIYLNFGNNETAIEYFFNAEKAAERAVDTTDIITSYAGICIVSANLGDSINLYKYVSKIEEYMTSVDMADYGSKVLNNIAQLYITIGKSEKAISYLQHAIVKAEKNRLPDDLVNYYSNLGYAYLLTGQVDTSYYYLKKSEKLCKRYNNSGQLLDVYKHLIDWHYYNKEYKKTIEYLDKHFFYKRFCCQSQSSPQDS